MLKPLLKHSKKTLAGFMAGLGIIFLIPLPASSQQEPANPYSNPANRSIRVNTSRSGPIRNGTLTGGNDTYPYGSRINANGIISTPKGERIIPSVSIKHGDGSTSYYYRDGSRLNIDSTNIPPTGTPIR